MSAFAAADEARASASLALRLAGHADAAQALATIRVIDSESASRVCSVACDLERTEPAHRDMLRNLVDALANASLVLGDDWLSRHCERSLARCCERVADALRAQALRAALDASNREYAAPAGWVAPAGVSL